MSWWIIRRVMIIVVTSIVGNVTVRGSLFVQHSGSALVLIVDRSARGVRRTDLCRRRSCGAVRAEPQPTLLSIANSG